MNSNAVETSLSRVLNHEAEAILRVAGDLTPEFQTAVNWMLAARGRVITCGIGKSGHIARKTAGTLSSTGTPSVFLHAAEAVHGDLGTLTTDDLVLLYSQSGETDEIVRLFPSIRSIGAKSILLTGRPDSSAGRQADLVLDTRVREEACLHNLAPTTSTTVMLAISDALAIAVMDERGFGPEDFAKFHPSGALGKRLLLTVADVMRQGEDLPIVRAESGILDVMSAISRAGAGAACVVDGGDRLVGFISDGDLRRHFLKSGSPLEAIAADLMTTKFHTIDEGLLAVEALEIFQNFPAKIGEIPVVGADGGLRGLLVLKDLLRSGIL